MSYSCTISFKTLNADMVYPFLQQFKNECIKHFSDIAEENRGYSPAFKRIMDCEPIKIENTPEFCELEKATEAWAKDSVFKFRWFYFADINLLGVYAVSDCIQHMFDNTVYFQNSCDQNYEFESWNGVPAFEIIANKYKNMSDKDLMKLYKEKGYGDWDEKNDAADLQYYARSFAYEEIWSIIENTLFDEDSVLYLSLFGHYDFMHMKEFFMATIVAVNEFIEELNKK